ncbi:DNA polymerase Y family protein [Tropicimonas sp. IMCC34043]|uniref:Y-family DNA polymerase n=1 Tax=Tropicimonas sp. IMCC34043 TaxID=2248760 RepID=UPI000E27E966|nr:DNA polymerase Y family protein [Tropicimonas sp. IMCC34043]
MSTRRILSLWFPRLAAERLLRLGRGPIDAPFAVVADAAGRQILSALSPAASAAGLATGQPLRDAQAMCPDLVTRPADPPAEAAFLAGLRRWAGRFSPWVAEVPPDALVIDLTGCAHLFGGEAAVMALIEQDCADLGLSPQAALADTVGAAWALARFGGQAGARSGVRSGVRSGDDIDQEARATRSRAARRRQWGRDRAGDRTHAGQAPAPTPVPGLIVAPGQTFGAIGALPVAALRLPPDTVAQLARLGLRRIDDLVGQPRAGLTRRFGRDLVLRLDQALGMVPEPVSPARPPARFAVRLSLPEPIGLITDLQAGIDRLLPPLAARLRDKGQGARRLQLQVLRCDHSRQTVEVGLARASADPERLRPLLAMKLDQIDAGPGIDALRLEATLTEPVHATQPRGHAEATAEAMGLAARRRAGPLLDDLIGRLGARVGLDAITRIHPGDSHIPEKTTLIRAVAWSEPASDWPPVPPRPRPLVLFRPEPVQVPQGTGTRPPARFRWRRRDLALARAIGPERIAPEWWLDEPEWRSGTRDYWDIVADTGDRLWIYYAHGGALSAGWFCQGIFA